MGITLIATILIAEPPLMQAQFDSLLSLVSEQKRERIARYKHYKDAQNSLLGDVLARAEICRITGLDNRELEFKQSGHGKPYLKNFPDIHFNISHSGHYVALAVDDKPVGIDIERFRQVNSKVAERFFAPDEIAHIDSAAGDERAVRFFEIWTKKESLTKREGKGVLNFNDSIDNTQLFFHEVYRTDDAVCHVCSEKQTPPQVKLQYGADYGILFT